MIKAADQRNKKYDETNKDLFKTFSISDEVLLKAYNVSDNEKKEIVKFFPKYKGPYAV